MLAQVAAPFDASAFLRTAGVVFGSIVALPVLLVLWKAASTFGALQQTVTMLNDTVNTLASAVRELTGDVGLLRTSTAVNTSDIETLKKGSHTPPQEFGALRPPQQARGG